jgi:hypothetical protein
MRDEKFHNLGRLPAIREMRRATIKTRKRILAIHAALPAMPPKPNMPATIATTKKINE